MGATFQILINKIFEKQLGKHIEVYVNNILVKSKRKEDHLEDLVETFNSLRKAKIKLKPSNCIFGLREGKFLGYMISPQGIKTNLEKVKAVLDMKPPKNVKEVHRLNGKVEALHRLIPRVADKCKTFFRLMKNPGK